MAAPLVLVGVIVVFIALAVLFYVVLTSRDEPQGVARSLAMLEHRIAHEEVGRNELPARDRLLVPMLERTRSLGTRLSPEGTSRPAGPAAGPGREPAGMVTGEAARRQGCGPGRRPAVRPAHRRHLRAGTAVDGRSRAGGFFLPDLLVYNAGLRRQDELRRGLADALDMLTVCVEAGQGFNAALLQVARSVRGPVAGEFARVLSEIQIGKSRAEAFAGLGERTSVDEIRTFVSALVQADRLGLPIANVLREQSKEMRVARRQRAEEKAQKVPVKIIFPVLLCIFPVIFIVILGPAVIRIMSSLFSVQIGGV